ncbi:MAG TPA: hypothetical protein VHL79_01430 [Ramlibacter sp.]|nr:hypothetical protein [Ramlibacter sp.]
MSSLSRFALRLRRRALRWYEIGLCAALLAMAVALALPSSSAEAGDEGVQCGNIHSSTVVMQR